MYCKKLVLGVVFLAVASLAFVVVTPVVKADQISDLQAQIAALMAQLQALQNQQGGGGQGFCHTFNTNLGYANSGNSEIGFLHTILKREGFSVSPDSDTSFTEATGHAVVQFQGKYGILQTGYVGPLTRAKLNVLYGCTSITTNGLAVSYMTISGNQSTYTAGQTITFSVKGIASDTSVGTPDKGFNVQYRLIDGTQGDNAIQVNGAYQAGNAAYNYSTGNWDVTLTVPSDSSKPYIVKSSFYCSTYRTISGPNVNSICVEGQIDKSFTFTIGSLSVTPAITILTSNQITNISPYIIGTATGLSQVGITLAGPSGDKVYGSGLIPVVNGQWSVTVSSILPFGKYTIYAYDANNNLLATSILNIVSSNSTQPAITVTFPSGNDHRTYRPGDTIPISWSFPNVTGKFNIILLDPRGGWSYHMIVKDLTVMSPSQTGTYFWNIPTSGGWFSNPMEFTGAGSYPFVIRVTQYTPTNINANGEGDWVPLQSAADATLHGDSQTFGILAPSNAPPTVVIVSNGQINSSNTETIAANTSELLGWTATNGSVCSGSVNNPNANGWGGPLSGTYGSFSTGNLVPGGYIYTISCQNSAGATGTASFTIIVPLVYQSQPAITVTSPNGGESWKVGETRNITWTSSNVDKVVIQLINPPNITPVATIATGISASSGSYSWVIPSTINPANSYQIMISNYNGVGALDVSDSTFSIVASTTSQNNSSLTAERLFPGQYGNTRYLVTVGDPDGLGDIVIKKADGSYLMSGSPRSGTTPCSTSANTGTVTLYASDFPLTGTVVDCKTSMVYPVQVQLPPVTVPPGTPVINISSVTGMKSSYAPGEKISFSALGGISTGTSVGPTQGLNVQAYVYKSGDSVNYLPPNPTYSYNGNYNSSSGLWDVTMNAPSDATTSYSVKVTLYCSRPSGYYSTNNCDPNIALVEKSINFQVASSASTQPSITVLNPNGGETFNQGMAYTLNWNSSGIPVGSSLRINLLDTSTGAYSLIANVTSTSLSGGSYLWTVPTNKIGSKFKVEIYNVVNAIPDDYSDGTFSIVAPLTSSSDNSALLSSLADAVARLAEQIKMLNK